MWDNGGWRDTTDGYVDQRGRCTVRLIGSLLEQLSATDTLRDNLRIVSPHIHMCRKYPEGISPSQGWGLQRKLHRSVGIFTPWGPQPQTGSHRGTGVRGTGSAAGQHSTGGCGSSAVRRCGGAAAHCAGWGIAPVAWPLLHCCSRPPTPLLALQLALQQPIPPPLSSSADSSARQQLPARPAAAILARALILPQRRYAGFYCCYHCCQLSYSLCHDRPCHANWPPVSPAPVSAPIPTRVLNSIGYFSRATLSRLRRQA